MAGQTINVISAPNASDADAATYTIARSDGVYYPDNIVFNDGVLKVTGLTYNSSEFGQNLTSVTDYYYDGKNLTFDAHGNLFERIPLADQSPASQGTHLQVSQLGDTFYVTEGALHLPAGATPVPASGSVAPPTGSDPVTLPAAPQNVTVHDTTTNTDLPDTSSAYTGPVAGITSQFIAITPDNLNIAAKADNLFIKTGAGNDAVALHGGTNVVDGGTGSNFITGGSGADTIFLDARNIPPAASAAGPVPGAIWNTIQEFGPGDAATFWGVTPGTALVWQKNEGAVGHTGLTLHANLLNGSTASLTLAGIDNKAGLSLSYGSSGGSSYLYVKSA